ncbi:uncharacterized protein LOC133310146 [Gastrolobium bilobum]|uniref:uncharacterized protein LOC133310146 n=1 Tax=Gastrolobium bilobum TaxID=150636 RepID=UPI002AAFBAD6|nr:uncharacterized protein LOC133310146 [Gastrolobium bilobum]
MELPEVLARSSRVLGITVIDGCLSLIQYPAEGLPKDATNIWMKREESWSKLYSLSPFEGNIRRLSGQSMNSEVLVIPSCSIFGEIMSLHSYDLKSQEMTELGFKRMAMALCASDFTCSLVLLDKGSYADVWVSSDEGGSSEEGESSDEGELRRKLKRQKSIDYETQLVIRRSQLKAEAEKSGIDR